MQWCVEIDRHSHPAELGLQRFGTYLPRVWSTEPSEWALARGCPQLSGVRSLTCANTNAPPWGHVPGGTNQGGGWQARYRDAAGRQHAKHFRRKVDAQDWLNAVSSSMVTGTYTDPRTSRITLEAWSATRFAGQLHLKATGRPGSRASSASTLCRGEGRQAFGTSCTPKCRPGLRNSRRVGSARPASNGHTASPPRCSTSPCATADSPSTLPRASSSPANCPRLAGLFLAEQITASFVGKGPDDLVFEGTRGGVLRNGNFNRRIFGPASIAIGEPDLTPHGLRHTAASLAIAAGGNVKVVQQMLRHATASMTLDLYGHLFSDQLDDVADRLDVIGRTAAQPLVEFSLSKGPVTPLKPRVSESS